MQLPNEISATFNRTIDLGLGTLEVWNKTTGFKIATYSASDVVLGGATMTIDITGLITTNGEYYIKTSGLILDRILGQSYSTTPDAVHGSDWWWVASDGDYKNVDYNNSDYFENP